METIYLYVKTTQNQKKRNFSKNIKKVVFKIDKKIEIPIFVDVLQDSINVEVFKIGQT